MQTTQGVQAERTSRKAWLRPRNTVVTFGNSSIRRTYGPVPHLKVHALWPSNRRVGLQLNLGLGPRHVAHRDSRQDTQTGCTLPRVIADWIPPGMLSVPTRVRRCHTISTAARSSGSGDASCSVSDDIHWPWMAHGINVPDRMDVSDCRLESDTHPTQGQTSSLAGSFHAHCVRQNFNFNCQQRHRGSTAKVLQAIQLTCPGCADGSSSGSAASSRPTATCRPRRCPAPAARGRRRTPHRAGGSACWGAAG